MTEPEAKRGLAAVAPGEAPTGTALLAALGGIRGLAESILPGLVFLIVFTITKSPWLSAIAPVAVALVFLVVRLVQRGPIMSAFAGLLLVGISAAAVLLTGNANENFLPGIWINLAFLGGIAISLIASWPLVGLVLGALTGDLAGWRRNARVRRAAFAATWLWAGLFAARLAAELPLYLGQHTEALAVVKLVMGVPLYAAVLWVTWLLMRTPKTPGPAVQPDSDPAAEI